MTATKRKALSACSGRNSKVTPPVTSGSGTESSSSLSLEENAVAVVNLTITRKTNKPLMEKRRRARINESLAVLKDLVVRETDNTSKLEKADILELTVKRVRELCDVHVNAQTSFRTGFDKCLDSVTDFLAFSGLGDLSERLCEHLRSRIPEFQLSLPDTPTTTTTTASASPVAVDSPEDLLMESEPINLTLSRHPYRRNCSVWRPW